MKKLKRVLMIAYHFPPLAGSSGIQRTLRFVQQLPTFGWEPIVLTAHPRAYEQVSNDLLSEIPKNIVVNRAFALDAARHLSIGRRYPRFLARPDRWASWRWGAVTIGLRLIQKYQPAAIWSTYPIATSHQIGAILQKRSGLPWIADFRDPMAQKGYPPDPDIWKCYKKIEEEVFINSRFAVFTSPSTAKMYLERYNKTLDHTVLIENGYDEESFIGLEASAINKGPLCIEKKTLLHSGIIYPHERNPSQLFQGIRSLYESGQISTKDFVLRLRAPVHNDWLKSLAAHYQVSEFIEIMPPLPYRLALEEMLRADGLVVLQANNCNGQIPAKLYEYLRCRRPILGLTDPAGDTGWALNNAGVHYITPLESTEGIISELSKFIKMLNNSSQEPPLIESSIEAASRLWRTRQLAKLLDRTYSQD